MPITKNYTINIELDVLTAGCVADLVNAILEFLLYQRNQIPLVYARYRHYVNKWSCADVHPDEEDKQQSIQDIQLARQRSLATITKDQISKMRQLIFAMFEKGSVKSLRFLFGATVFTPQEIYTVHIPTDQISRTHNHAHHPLSATKMNYILIALLTCEDLYSIFTGNLATTNVFLELEMLEDPTGFTKNEIHPKDIAQLPSNCKDIHLHLTFTRPANLKADALRCCKDLKIFEDFQHLNVSKEDENKENRTKPNTKVVVKTQNEDEKVVNPNNEDKTSEEVVKPLNRSEIAEAVFKPKNKEMIGEMGKLENRNGMSGEMVEAKHAEQFAEAVVKLKNKEMIGEMGKPENRNGMTGEMVEAKNADELIVEVTKPQNEDEKTEEIVNPQRTDDNNGEMDKREKEDGNTLKVVKRKKTNQCSTPAWWEADVIVRGFREKPIKGFNLWSI